MAVSAPKFDAWYANDPAAELSAKLGDPPGVAEVRRRAYDAFLELPVEPNPLYRKYAYVQGINLAGSSAALAGPPVVLPPLPEALVRIVHDASGTRVEIPAGLREAGVEARALPEIWADRSNGLPSIWEGVDPHGPRSDKFEALSYALLNRAVELVLPPRLEVPIRVQDLTVFSAPGEVLSVGRTVRAGERTQLLYSEEVYSTGDAPGQRFYGSVADVSGDDAARVAWLTLLASDRQVVTSASRRARMGRGGILGWVWAGFGGFRTKLRNYSDLVGQGSRLNDLQAFYGDGQQSVDSYVQVTHIGTDTTGQSISRGVFKDEARGVSRGLVRIEKEARKTISLLSEHAMLLSRGARSDTVPVLEILCRDVKATHSSSVAPIDPERIFYLESRGISEPDAIRMIGEGFLSYVFERAPIAGLHEVLYPQLSNRWEGRYLFWKEGAFPVLPALRIADPETGEEWRFDAKLRWPTGTPQ